MMKYLLRAGPVLACMAMLAFAVSNASASTLDFNCPNPTACTGTVVQSGSNFNDTGTGDLITDMTESSHSDPGLDPNPGVEFTLSFDTSSSDIWLLGPGTLKLGGVITGFSTSGDDLLLVVLWNNLPSAYSSFLGTPNGITSPGSVITVTSNSSGPVGAVVSADVPINPTPEPASMLLFGLGLLAFGIYLKRRPHSSATA